MTTRKALLSSIYKNDYFAATSAALSQTRPMGRAHLLPLEERLLQPGDFHSVGHADGLILQTQDPNQTDEDGPRGRQPEF